MRLEEERMRVEQEAARLETERMEAIIAKEELARQAEDQLRSQEQLVSLLRTKTASRFTLLTLRRGSSDHVDGNGNHISWAFGGSS